MAGKITLTILVSIILTVIIVSLVNVGLSLFLERPNYEDYCGEFKTQEIIDTQERCEEIGGQWNSEGKTRPIPADIENPPLIDGYCDRDFTCRQELDEAQDSFNQIRYYIFAAIGFILLLIGLFAKENLIQLTGLASGGILVFEGIVTNFENKTIVFISLLAILIIFGVVAVRVIKKAK